MPGCCSEEEKVDEKISKEKSEDGKAPKSLVSKYLYKLGKEDFEKSKGKAKKGCC